jgi:hypothetical protein
MLVDSDLTVIEIEVTLNTYEDAVSVSNIMTDLESFSALCVLEGVLPPNVAFKSVSVPKIALDGKLVLTTAASPTSSGKLSLFY